MVAPGAEVVHVKAGETLITEGDTGNDIFVIRRGSMIIEKAVGGKSVFLSYLPAGSYVGEMALIDGTRRTATVKAAIRSEVIRIPGAAFKALLDRKPGLLERTRKDMASRRAVNAFVEDRKGHFSSVVDMYSETARFPRRQCIGEATDVLLIDETLCVGCDNCEKACADSHDGLSRLDREAGKTYAHLHVPTSCRHCEHPHCMADCPPNAIKRGPDGEVVIDDTCIGCGNCQRNCPYGVIRMDSVPPRKPPLLSWLFLGLGPGPRRAQQDMAQEACPAGRGHVQEGDQVRHVLGHRRRAGLRARLPHRRGTARGARGVPVGGAAGGLTGSWRPALPGPPPPRSTVRRNRNARHHSFLSHANYRWLKIGVVLSLICLIAYALIDQQPRANGGSWLGYTLGTLGALLILWLSLLGIRKRAMTPGRWSLKGWTSAHVYLGLALIVIATLHCAFQFGWNVHTLAYVLMMLVILSGIYGAVAYALLPRVLSQGREGLTENQMLEGLRAVDRQLHDAAQPLAQADTRLVHDALLEDPLSVSVWRRLSGHHAGCATRLAIEGLSRATRLPARSEPRRPRPGQGRGPAGAPSGRSGADAPSYAHQGPAGGLALCPCAADHRAVRCADRAYRQRLLLLVTAARMTFRIRQISETADGREIVRVTEPIAALVSIGRASDCDVHLPDLAVEPLQAIAETQDDGFVSINATGTLAFSVDGRDTRSARLDPAKGAKLRFGSHRIILSADPDGIPVLTVRRAEAISESAAEMDRDRSFSLSGALPSKRKMAWGAFALILLAFLAVPVVSNLTRAAGPKASVMGDKSWSSGPLKRRAPRP